jgi:hypothetical protein
VRDVDRPLIVDRGCAITLVIAVLAIDVGMVRFARSKPSRLLISKLPFWPLVFKVASLLVGVENRALQTQR